MTTSSKTSSTPWRRVISRSPFRKPGWGGTSRWNGSTMTAASSSAWAAMMPSTVPRSLYGAISTSASSDCGMPEESGTGAGKALGERGEELIIA